MLLPRRAARATLRRVRAQHPARRARARGGATLLARADAAMREKISTRLFLRIVVVRAAHLLLPLFAGNGKFLHDR